MNSFALLSKLQLPSTLGLQKSNSDYLENIILDSFMTSAVLNRDHQPNSTYFSSEYVPLNSLCKFLTNFDFIERANQIQEQGTGCNASQMCL
mmetsp:Transcript_15710/g.18154  ORF Transcript_15710/g.18154 Transcript_15710/m.18154 type:complete len:92 (+) Transcript_15710:40-315(+)